MKATLVLLTLSAQCLFVGACPLSKGSSKTKFVLGGIELSCGPNTEFSQAACTCVHARPAVPWQALITTITFDLPHPYGAADDPFVSVFDVEIETDPGICSVSGNCGYFDSRKEAHLEIPFFAGDQRNKFAISFWYRRTANKGGAMGLVNNGNCKVEPTIALMSEQNISIGRLETEQSQFYMAGYRAVDGLWHMFTMSYDGSYVSVYVDNKVADGGDITGMTKITPLPMNIGSMCADPFDGHMDSISFFKRALTAADVQSLYNNRGVCSPP